MKREFWVWRLREREVDVVPQRKEEGDNRRGVLVGGEGKQRGRWAI